MTDIAAGSAFVIQVCPAGRARIGFLLNSSRRLAGQHLRFFAKRPNESERAASDGLAADRA